jgi:Fungal specific transcription factor domain
MSQSVVDTAFHYLFKSYVPDSNFNYLPGMLSELSSSKCFTCSADAVALANLARQQKDGRLVRFSRRLYVKAIREVNLALKSKEVMKNSTLVATLILGLFEAIALNDENQPENSSTLSGLASWIAHTNGTFSLIKFRGKELLHTDFGRRVYFQVANKIRANHSQTCKELPSDFLKLDNEMIPLLQDIGLSVHSWPIIDTLTNLRAKDRGQSIACLSRS